MLLLQELHILAVQRQFEHSDHIVRHELRGDGAACEAGKFLAAAREVLRGLNDA